ncbi:short-chain dehydrogenase [Penicillium frequentans]|uniref:Short-chain dehydrogenase n=1 Tax=Penicillium frequentans TaxID=3151616 RepID=A0AAD6D7P5_9EURO|nr:short-chain dehydrogenase [Penicillium glabrum]
MQISLNLLLGPLLCIHLLLPSLKAAAAIASPGFVRVIWMSSKVLDFFAPPEGLIMESLTNSRKSRRQLRCLVGEDWFIAVEMAL